MGACARDVQRMLHTLCLHVCGCTHVHGICSSACVCTCTHAWGWRPGYFERPMICMFVRVQLDASGLKKAELVEANQRLGAVIACLHHASIMPPSYLHHAFIGPASHPYHVFIMPPSRLHHAFIVPPSGLHHASIVPLSYLHHAWYASILLA